jgi:hypothetical protein
VGKQEGKAPAEPSEPSQQPAAGQEERTAARPSYFDVKTDGDEADGRVPPFLPLRPLQMADHACLLIPHPRQSPSHYIDPPFLLSIFPAQAYR